MYPLHLVTDTQKIYQSAFRQFASQFNARVLKLVERSSRQDVLQRLVWLEQSQGDFSQSVAHDADLFTWLEELRQSHGDDVPKEKFQKQLTMNAQQVNAFSRAQFNKSIQGARAFLRLKNETSASIGVVDMTRSEHLTAEKVTSFVRTNVSLIDDLTQGHMESIIAAVRDGVIRGQSNNEIAETITTETKKNEHQAAFWAEDQVGNLFGDVTQERQTGAGVPGYIWRCLNDDRVRDMHGKYGLDGTYHRWDTPPASGSGSRIFSHPGKGWKCRCYAELAWGPQDADRKFDPDELKKHIERNKVKK